MGYATRVIKKERYPRDIVSDERAVFSEISYWMKGLYMTTRNKVKLENLKLFWMLVLGMLLAGLLGVWRIVTAVIVVPVAFGMLAFGCSVSVSRFLAFVWIMPKPVTKPKGG